MEPRKADIIYRTEDHPEANGRTPQPGEKEYTLSFPLDTGETLALRCGIKTFHVFRDFINQMYIDDFLESVGEEPIDVEAHMQRIEQRLREEEPPHAPA